MHRRSPTSTGSDPPEPVPPHQFRRYLLTRTQPRFAAVPATNPHQSHQNRLADMAQDWPDFSTQSTRPTASSPPESQRSIPTGFRHAKQTHLRPTIWFARPSGAALPAYLHGRPCHSPPQKGPTTPDLHLIVRQKNRSNQTLTLRDETTGDQCQDIGALVSIFGFLQPVVESTHGWWPKPWRKIFECEIAKYFNLFQFLPNA